MKAKLFSFFAILMMALTAHAETVTVVFNTSTDGRTLNKDGVTCNKNFGGSGPYTFTTASGVFTRIAIHLDDGDIDEEVSGWSGNDYNQTWTGSAQSVTFNGYISIYSDPMTITFTIDRPATVDVTGVTLSQTSASMTVGGETLTLTATVAPDNGTNRMVTWTTSDAAVATVTDTGVVTAVGAGTATITVTATNGTADDTSDDKTATCTVTVSTAGTTQYAVTVKDGTADADKWTASPNPAEAGETVTVTYSGKKKVKTVTVTKKE